MSAPFASASSTGLEPRKSLLPGLDARPDAAAALFRRLLETSPDALVVIDISGRILLANLQAERLFEYPVDELVGQNVDVLIPARLRAAHALHRQRYTEGPRLRPMGSGLALCARKRGGAEFPVEISLSPLTLGEGAGEHVLFSANIRDISERLGKEAEFRLLQVSHEEALRHARALAEAASAAKSEFLTSMSHELRTPLNAILGFAQLLQRDKKSPLSTRQKVRIDHVLRGGEHLLRLIDDVLDLSRIEAGNVLISPESVNVAEILAEVRDTLAPMAAGASIGLDIEPLDHGAHEVIADRTRFKQILMNYGSNAIKYGRSGGHAKFCFELRGSVARISVVDDGPGIALAKQQVMFQPFQRAGQEAGPIEGTGIGLIITKRLAELMHGAVGFESTEGSGSRFWIELPVQRQAQPVSGEPAPVLPAGDSMLAGKAGPRYVIVYVEDNPSNIAFMIDLLADLERVELLTAPTAEIGIEIVRARRPDVVIMDINLPGMSGFEATQKLASWPETRNIPVIALSAAAMIRDAARSAGAGFYRYLTKPVKVDELTGVLEELLTRRKDEPLE
jgi:PAS domain S-box-containing protein